MQIMFQADPQQKQCGPGDQRREHPGVGQKLSCTHQWRASPPCFVSTCCYPPPTLSLTPPPEITWLHASQLTSDPLSWPWSALGVHTLQRLSLTPLNLQTVDAHPCVPL